MLARATRICAVTIVSPICAKMYQNAKSKYDQKFAYLRVVPSIDADDDFTLLRKSIAGCFSNNISIIRGGSCEYESGALRKQYNDKWTKSAGEFCLKFDIEVGEFCPWLQSQIPLNYTIRRGFKLWDKLGAGSDIRSRAAHMFATIFGNERGFTSKFAEQNKIDPAEFNNWLDGIKYSDKSLRIVRVLLRQFRNSHER